MYVNEASEEANKISAVMSVERQDDSHNESESDSESDNDDEEGEREVVDDCSKDDCGASLDSTPVYDLDISSHVYKWIESADEMLKGMLLKKLAKLRAGHNSYAMCKRLKGTVNTPVFETKLDSGQRILWTKVNRENERASIIVWRVSKHDDVSRNMHCIDASLNRVAGLSISPNSETLLLSESQVLLDPFGNSPLKLFCKRESEPISTSSKFPLRLTKKEKEINDSTGAVLIFGRSGTGKTVCLCDRIRKDKEAIPSVRQLFVARSSNLCSLVKAYQQSSSDVGLSDTKFITWKEFLQKMDKSISRSKGKSKIYFTADRRVTFIRFRDELWGKIRSKRSKRFVDGMNLSPSVVWTQIQSFLKGSIEVVIDNQFSFLTEQQYNDRTVFPKDRCRLETDQRKEAYAIFETYQELLSEMKLWDDSDKVLDLLRRSELDVYSDSSVSMFSDDDSCKFYDKVYIDEIQDFSQAETVLFFLSTGLNTQSAFMVGDTAQAVEEGISFRFEEIRSTVHKLSNKTQTITKPFKLETNFRSHSGVLTLAAAVLVKMFLAFPASSSAHTTDSGMDDYYYYQCYNHNNYNYYNIRYISWTKT